MKSSTPPPGYLLCCQQLAVLFRIWIENQDRHVNVQFYEWNSAVYMGALSGPSLDFLCATPDARSMCEWADEQTRPPRKATLLQAMVVAEHLGLKTKGVGPAVPASAFRGVQTAVVNKNSTRGSA
jgi:hypothetical protein